MSVAAGLGEEQLCGAGVAAQLGRGGPRRESLQGRLHWGESSGERSTGGEGQSSLAWGFPGGHSTEGQPGGGVRVSAEGEGRTACIHSQLQQAEPKP